MANIQNRFILPPQIFVLLIWNSVENKVSHCDGALQTKEYISAHHVLYESRTQNLYHSKKTWGGIMNRLSNWMVHITSTWVNSVKNLQIFYFEEINIFYDAIVLYDS